MLDEFREDTSVELSLDDLDTDASPANRSKRTRRSRVETISPFQRFLLAGLLFCLVTFAGLFFLVITGRISLPL